MTRAFAVSLIIPDNEAFTALETLARLDVPVARVQRSEIWLFDLEPSGAPGLAETVASIETIHNPNKHRLVERPSDAPEPGEVWIAPRDDAASARVAGRSLPGVRAIRRRTAWRLAGADGRDISPADLQRAVATFLCNPAFQMAIHA